MSTSKSTAETVAYRWQRYHASLQTGHFLTVQSKRQDPVRVFFGQGDIDGACGVHVLSAVLVLMGLAKNSALQDMPRRKYGVPAEVWAAFQHTFFCGVHAHEFVELADSLKLPLNLTLRQDKDGGLDKWTVDNLLRGELLAVTFASVKNRRTKHWALCVGCEGHTSGRDSQTDTILLLDPAGSEPSFQAANSRLCVPQSGPGSRGGKTADELRKSKGAKPIDWLYEGPEWATEPMRLTAAVRFRFADWT
jgi:hypothetical protein